MDISNAENVKSLLKKYHIHPNKLLGQNFLVNENVLDLIINSANLNKKDFVLEIGPGLGVLSKKLSEKAGTVISVEKDKKMINALIDNLISQHNIKVVNGDIFNFLESFEEKKYKVVANIPYYITSSLIRTLLERENQPEKIVLLIQKEVAERICAAPPRMSLLSVSVQLYSDPIKAEDVGRDNFFPAPNVDSAILVLSNIKKDKYSIDKDKFFNIVKAGFKYKRKTLENNLSQNLNIPKKNIQEILSGLEIDSKRRAETLSIEEWIRISSRF